MTDALIFAHWAPVYRELGYWPRPITIGSKACHIAGWQRPDHEIPAAELASWLTKYGHLGIGLLMGSPFPDGTTLGALDIDDDAYVRIGRALLRDPPCGRIGERRCFSSACAGGSAIPSSAFGGKGRQGRRVPLHQETLRHPADDPPRHRPAIPLDRDAPARDRFP